MNLSPYDFDTRFAPFQAFAPWTPFAPWALTAWLTAPAQWWLDACFNTCGLLSEAVLGAMVYPYALPASRGESGHASPMEQTAA